ncbi:uncharacterized protein UTRI_04546 [Ustilago trichophora]|uniref:Effector family protein Eff1 n=1 Tax=Ustilago trichophora TaxID=86804 RepID=A0A5C3EDY4_9BASI|nr:uncharacterized protein UTRI_04546 [Ustilago trichophora]
MFVRKGVKATRFQVAVLLLLSFSALGLAWEPFVSIAEGNEHRETNEAQEWLGPDSFNIEGPEDGDLYRPPATYTPPLPQVKTVEFPIAGLVRGQDTIFVPYQLHPRSTSIQIWNQVTAPMQESGKKRGRRWYSSWKEDKERPVASPENEKKRLSQLFSEIRGQVPIFDKELTPDESTVGKRFHVVRLQGTGLDVEILTKVMEMKQPFFLQEAEGKVWYFHTKDGKIFTYTDRVRSSDKRSIWKLPSLPLNRPLFRAAARAKFSAAASSGILADTRETTPPGTPAATPPRFFGSPTPFGQMERSQSRYNPRWYRKLSGGARSFFKKPAEFFRSIHGM